MSNVFHEIVSIIDRQAELYEEFLSLERKKTDCISGNLTKELEGVVSDQERVLSQIDLIESSRVNCVRKISGKFYINKANPSLRDIAQYADDLSSKEMINCAEHLKKITNELQRLLETNARMLRDNMNFYSLIVEGIKDSLDDKSAYSAGKESRMKKSSVLINRTV
ncbi:MAG: flagellar protein FlgN [Spirochaetes bacterium]|nr:flagellar protein FlgN [Spirochaetota bacterium]